MRVNIESFEKWYANQIKYHKVNGEEPGKELKEWSYSVPELAEMLELTDGVIYDPIKQNKIEVVIVDYWKRVPKAAFQKWYDGQSRYRTKEDKRGMRKWRPLLSLCRKWPDSWESPEIRYMAS